MEESQESNPDGSFLDKFNSKFDSVKKKFSFGQIIEE